MYKRQVLGVGAFLGIGNALGFIDYTVIWRYFSWTNQTLAMIVLCAASMYLFKEKKNFWITAVPATFMSAVSCTYFVLAPECLGKMINTDERCIRDSLAVRLPTSGPPGSHGVTGGVYKARERIHRGMLIHDY